MARLLDTVHSYILPHSRYSTSMKGLSWSQVVNSPLPPYLSPLPVIFRVLAYLVIAPVIGLLILDFGGYIVWRIYDQPFWSGTRTAFYKFRTSPVFTKSRTNSPTSTKVAQLGSTLSPEGKEASISPISSSGSLHEHVFGGLTDGASTSPPSPVLSKSPQLAGSNDGDGLYVKEKEKDVVVTDVSPLKRSNSLGLGFERDESANTNQLKSPSSNPVFIASPTPSSSAIETDGSPTSSSSNLDEDDKAFREAKAVVT